MNLYQDDKREISYPEKNIIKTPLINLTNKIKTTIKWEQSNLFRLHLTS
jgi:hypothetical protein